VVERSVVAFSDITAEKRCANCVHGNKIVTYVAGKNVSEEGTDTGWYLVEPKVVGQIRSCFGYLQRVLLQPEIFVHPNESDSCINLKEYKRKE